MKQLKGIFFPLSTINPLRHPVPLSIGKDYIGVRPWKISPVLQNLTVEVQKVGNYASR